MMQIDVPQGGKKPGIRVSVKRPISIIVTPKPRDPKVPLPVSKPPKKNPVSVIDVIFKGVLPIATNPIIPGTGLPLLPTRPGMISTPLPGLTIDPTKPITLPEFPDIKLPGLPAFPDLGLPNIGKFFDDLKVGGGLVLLGIGGLIALLIITRK